ncbi:MAG: hypothetical protein AB2A00_15390 [Myxococcota bacterium]
MTLPRRRAHVVVVVAVRALVTDDAREACLANHKDTLQAWGALALAWGLFLAGVFLCFLFGFGLAKKVAALFELSPRSANRLRDGLSFLVVLLATLPAMNRAVRATNELVASWEWPAAMGYVAGAVQVAAMICLGVLAYPFWGFLASPYK